jgi:hypothetical protein
MLTGVETTQLSDCLCSFFHVLTLFVVRVKHLRQCRHQACTNVIHDLLTCCVLATVSLFSLYQNQVHCLDKTLRQLLAGIGLAPATGGNRPCASYWRE